MSVVTKIFVVLVAVMAVVLVALVVPFVARTDDYQNMYKNALQYQQVLTLSAQNAGEAMNTALATVKSINEAGLAEKGNLETTIAGLNQQLADANAALEKERSNSATITADMTRLTTAEKEHADINHILQDQVSQLRDDLLREQKSRVDLASANDRLETDLDAAKRELTRQSEDLTDLQEKNNNLEARWAMVPAEVRSKLLNPSAPGEVQPFESATPIRGQITRVQQIDDSTLAEINIGKADGVAKNMKFLVYRDSTYLGTLVISNVDNKAAAGSLEVSSGKQVTKGDGVLTGGTF